MYGHSSKFPDYGSTNPVDDDIRPRTVSNTSLCNQLCDNIGSNIQTISNNVLIIEKLCRDIGTLADTEHLRDRIHENRQSTNEIIGTTTRFVKDLKRVVMMEGRDQRLRAERFESEFLGTVERYDMLQRVLVPKMKQTLMTKIKNENLVNMNDEEQEDQQSLIDSEQIQRQKEVHDLEFEHGLLVEREARVKQIEADVLDVNKIFRDLGAIVHEQGDMIGTIEENISHTAHNVEGGTMQLSKASSYEKKYRTKLCFLMLIVLIIAAVVAIIIVVSKP